jgi:hypothetical protein
MAFEDPELIKKYIVEIKKFADLDYYQELKKQDRLQFEFSLRDVFPQFAKEHPFLFRKIVLGDDLTFLYKMLDSISKINSGTLTQQQAEMTLGTELADLYVYPALSAANSNVQVQQQNNNPNGFSLPLSALTNPDILNH